jgi:hypothetical protein
MKAVVSLLSKAAIAVALAALVAAPSVAEDKPTMGKCTAAQKAGDQCAVGICTSGKQTIYTCAADKTCTKADKKQDCKAPESKAAASSSEKTKK